ncbi:MAG: phosphoribosyl-AMP cyclohydrolase [Actinomycetota bacterium]
MTATSVALEGLRFDERGLAPAVVQDVDTKEVPMLAYVDAEAIRRTISTGTAWFRSRSRDEYWNKGATSGNVQDVVDVRYDCGGDAVLVLVKPRRPSCHTGEYTCFDRAVASDASDASQDA